MDRHERRTRRTGSSPRVRGKRLRRAPRLARRGLIPARAGKTGRRRTWGRVLRAHPRACGENPPPVLRPRPGAGSSPRVRGKRPAPPRRRGGLRLIPARAGKTGDAAELSRGHWAHPRACGENGDGVAVLKGADGSSPRVRGKRPADEAPPLSHGLIPARAGKTPPDLGFYRSGRSDLGNPRAFRLFWKLLIPGRPRKRRAVSGASAGSVYWPRPWASAGRIMSRMPSKSTGRQGSPQVRNSRPCSLRAL